ncbi:hypothetical protein [Mesorhizobium sp. L103C131B0]|uniref:hypothetical protein n=1 Tax=Mesorhizobium sp. L103C131B0 TaxID=1287089 RepID=UPI0003CFE7C8|nr:hypothetical protein [Mesorhizobium sp. L103C131B0]ESZ56625.1 hypothetical protein X729_24065 [Mesorhizobium sp. L103C131B0]
MNDASEIDSELTGEERARSHREAGISAYGESYGRDFHSQLQRAIWGDSDDALLYDDARCERQRKRVRVQRNFITYDQFLDLYKAVCFANANGWIMNVEITINFGYLGIVKHEDIFETFRLWLGRYRNWCLERDIAAVYVYSWERPAGASLHVQMQNYVPAAHHEELRAWARTTVVSLARAAAHLLHTQPHMEMRSDATIVRQWWRFRYLIKGLRQDLVIPGGEGNPPRSFAEYLGLKAEVQGDIHGKRVGASRSISRKARKADIHDQAFFEGRSLMPDVWSDAFYQRYKSMGGPGTASVGRLF